MLVSDVLDLWADLDRGLSEDIQPTFCKDLRKYWNSPDAMDQAHPNAKLGLWAAIYLCPLCV